MLYPCPNSKHFDSIAMLLDFDMTTQSGPENKQKMKKILLENNQTHCSSEECLNLLKSISSRLVGIGSLYFPKNYGPNKSFYDVSQNMLEEVNKSVTKNLEKALFLRFLY